MAGLQAGMRKGASAARVPGAGGWAYLADEGLCERLPVGAERARRVVSQQVLQPLVGAVLAQHHVAPIPELGQQEVAAASPAPGGRPSDQSCLPLTVPGPPSQPVLPLLRQEHPAHPAAGRWAEAVPAPIAHL